MNTEIEIPDDLFKALEYVAAKRRTVEQSEEEAAALPVALLMERLNPFLAECADLMQREQKQAREDKLNEIGLQEVLAKLGDADAEKQAEALAAAKAVLDQ